ncbi:MAG: response regulator [Leptospiraceae bacterium]|nr:response regulator [Leptospiraceae bacterium]
MSILVIDDEPFNLVLIENILKKKFSVITVSSGEEAFQVLENSNREIKCILLDWNMPEMNGLEFLEKIKSIENYKKIPIIIQTSDTSKETILKGINAGAFQYLTKPLDSKQLISQVSLAIQEYEIYFDLLKNYKFNSRAFSLLEKAKFKFRTLEECKNLAYALSSLYRNPENVITGIIELFANAIEHGNLNISYNEKTDLLEQGLLDEEIKIRENLPENINKKVIVSFEKNENQIILRIKDDGNGFDYENFLNKDILTFFDSHGRGIFMAKKISFDKLNYFGKGNELEAIVELKK